MALGLDSQTIPVEYTSGIGANDVPTRYADVSIIVPGIGSFETRAGFARDFPFAGYGLLGQIGFFENFRVFFDYSGGYFNLETK